MFKSNSKKQEESAAAAAAAKGKMGKDNNNNDDSPEHPLSKTKNHARGKSTTTINQLMAVRREASTHYQRAARAEASYRARKQTASARAALKESGTHFREGFAHLRDGFRGLGLVLRAAPSFLAERREKSRVRSEEKKRLRIEGRRKKLEEELARSDVGAGDTTGDEKEGEGAAAAGSG